MNLILIALIPVLLSALSGWRNARDVGAFKAALPVPAFLFVSSAALGLCVIMVNDWMDLRYSVAATLSLFGIIVAGASLLVGWGAGHLRLRQDRSL